MTVRKFKLFLGPNIHKEEEWLTEMSKKGLHLKKYRLFNYFFEEDPEQSYVYQIDFRQEATKDYLQLYEDAGWEHVTNAMSIFHYFRKEASNTDVKKIYSDKNSIQDNYKRMLIFYLFIFFFFLISQLGIIVSWKGPWHDYLLVGGDIVIVVVYLYMFYILNKRINFFRNK
ncbi:DUF2812 domain-containing protein [Gracilibacillus oryzae]|uniref:DUF2812 domain-containing protein n=1 Tax=Gracilibacillus oryzae TaxID=1672701 RepID=A0A7C8L4L9_9BACI|nr:DUF2812 domain-containing protein [Gracilibacillus oryzae]KAB8126629.1 DUF2812 domain-containing protein [Gracilibacillus oryzae]